MKPALTPKRPRRLSLRQQYQRTLPYLSDTEFDAVTLECHKIRASHPDLLVPRRFFIALAAVRARQRVAAEAV
jgi:hypothetical protein